MILLWCLASSMRVALSCPTIGLSVKAKNVRHRGEKNACKDGNSGSAQGDMQMQRGNTKSVCRRICGNEKRSLRQGNQIWHRAEHHADARAVFRAEKNGSDAEPFAEGMQKVRLKLYEFSTKLDVEKHRYNGLVRIIPVAEGLG